MELLISGSPVCQRIFDKISYFAEIRIFCIKYASRFARMVFRRSVTPSSGFCGRSRLP